MPGSVIVESNQPPSEFNSNSDRSRFLSWLRRDIKPVDIIVAIAATVVALGWTFTSPNHRVTLLEARVARNEQRLDSLTSTLQFTNYLQCVQLRRSDATMLPPGCAPILEQKEKRP